MSKYECAIVLVCILIAVAIWDVKSGLEDRLRELDARVYGEQVILQD